MPSLVARRHPVLGLLLFVVVALTALAVAGTGVALLLAPAALLTLPLLFGRYPGERVIRRLARRAGVRHLRCSVAVPRAPRSLGARLAALAVPGSGRAPPAPALI